MDACWISSYQDRDHGDLDLYASTVYVFPYRYVCNSGPMFIQHLVMFHNSFQLFSYNNFLQNATDKILKLMIMLY